MNKAVFLDRDGVINQLIVNPLTQEVESPNNPSELVILPGVIEALKKILKADYLLFIISNQPSYAKGKTSLENLFAVHDKLHSVFVENGILFSEYYYCYHHPEGIIPEYSIKCDCRKPGQKNVIDAIKKYNLDVNKSWFVGDQDMDIECGKIAGIKTILIENELSISKRGKTNPDYFAKNLPQAVDIILKNES